MSDLKFNSFLYDVDQKIHFLSELTSDNVYRTKFYGHIRCPECKKAHLVLSHSANGKEHLRTAPNSEHGLVNGDVCYYAQEPAPQYAIKEHLDNLKKVNKLESKLESLIRLLKSRDLKITAETNEADLTKILSLKYMPKKATKEKQAVIPKISINRWSEVPEGELVAVYGKVRIEVAIVPQKKNPEKNNLYWNIRSLKTGKRITSIWATYCPIKISSGNYYFATFGQKEIYNDVVKLKPYDLVRGIMLEPF